MVREPLTRNNYDKHIMVKVFWLNTCIPVMFFLWLYQELSKIKYTRVSVFYFQFFVSFLEIQRFFKFSIDSDQSHNTFPLQIYDLNSALRTQSK